MVNYWKSKVLPKIKKVFENPKKTAAAEACKAFDEAKDQYSKELEERKTELQPKVIEIYEASSTEIKTLVKEPKASSLKKHSAVVHKFLDELAKIEFPGSKPACDAATKVGPGYVAGPFTFVLEKVSAFVVVKAEEEEKKDEPPKTEPAAAAVEEVVAVKEKEIAEKEELPSSSEKVDGPCPGLVGPPKVEEEAPVAAPACNPTDEPAKP